MQTKGFAENTISSYIRKIKKIFNESDIDSYEDNIDIFFSGIEKVKDSTIDSYVVVAVRFQEFLLKNGVISFPVDISYKYKTVSKKNHLVKTLSDKDVKKVINYENVNDRLAMIILLDTGIRINEFDYFNNVKDWKDKVSIPVTGKSKNERLIVISDRMRKLAEEIDGGVIWPNSYQARYKRIKQVAAEIGIEMNPHIFRHTFATNWIYSGHNPYLLIEALGHTSLNQLKHYVAKNQKALIEEWSNNNEGRNNHDTEALKSELKFYKLEKKRLERELEEAKNG